MRLVILESPYAGDIELNERYARAAMRDCFLRGEAPMASHLLYTQPGVLRDDVASERNLGIVAGMEWGLVADATVVYTDLGTSTGMRWGVRQAEHALRPVEYRYVPGWAEGRERKRKPEFSDSFCDEEHRRGDKVCRI